MADPLDALYAAKPDDFTALRTELAAQAKKRGDAEEAKRIGAARKPTTAAWIVNALALADRGVSGQLTDLGERLRAAHTGMDGAQIRELSSEQRHLVEELARRGFAEAKVSAPSAALREDVTATLQAAVADPEVTGRLGRLTKAEQWSGFGDFGDTPVDVSAAAPARERERETRAARERLAAAERLQEEAEHRLREAERRLRAAEAQLAAAREDHDSANKASRAAAAAVEQARAAVAPDE